MANAMVGGFLRDESGALVLAGAGGSSPNDQPSFHGLAGWTGLPETHTTSSGPAAGFGYFNRIYLPAGATIANLTLSVSAALTGSLTAGQSFVGIYNSAGTLIGSSAALDTIAGLLTSTGVKTIPVTAQGGQSLTIAAAPTAHVFGVILLNGTLTALSLHRLITSPMHNAGIASAPFRTGSLGGGLTALPATMAAAVVASGDTGWFFGVS